MGLSKDNWAMVVAQFKKQTRAGSLAALVGMLIVHNKDILNNFYFDNLAESSKLSIVYCLLSNVKKW